MFVDQINHNNINYKIKRNRNQHSENSEIEWRVLTSLKGTRDAETIVEVVQKIGKVAHLIILTDPL